MANPTLGNAVTETQLEILWTSLTSGVEIGNSEILAYELYWDA